METQLTKKVAMNLKSRNSKWKMNEKRNKKKAMPALRDGGEGLL